MTNIQQEYTVGEPFNAYTSVELSTSDWKWDYRTLSGLRKEDGTFIPLGGEIKFDELTANLSGVWTLNKTGTINLKFIGQSGNATVKISECNKLAPLASDAKLFFKQTDFQSDSILNTYYSSAICVDVIPDANTTIKSIWLQFHQNPPEECPVGQQLNITNYVSPGNITGISVDYVQGGIVTYHSNKNVMNS